MRKKILLFTSFVLFVNLTIAQSGEINYTQSTHFSRDFYRNFTLKFNKKSSIYLESNIKKEKEKIKQIEGGEGTQLDMDIPRNNLNPEFFFNDKVNFYFMEVWYDKELLVKEDNLTWNWNLKKDMKKIGNFNCQKATIKFRGRNYIAWFTQEIPVPFGPWKFQGLPGVILEVYDTDKVFHIIATKFKTTKKANSNIKVDKSKFKSALTIKQFLKKKVELIKEDYAKLSSRLPKGYEPMKYDENCDDCREEVELFKK